MSEWSSKIEEMLIRGSEITERKTGIATLDQHRPCEGWSLTFSFENT